PSVDLFRSSSPSGCCSVAPRPCQRPRASRPADAKQMTKQLQLYRRVFSCTLVKSMSLCIMMPGPVTRRLSSDNGRKVAESFQKITHDRPPPGIPSKRRMSIFFLDPDLPRRPTPIRPLSEFVGLDRP